MTPRYGLLLALLAVPAAAPAQTAADSSSIRATALDYVEGWYEGNPERMGRALHPELVKRIVASDTTTKRSVLENMGAILDIFGNAASVKAVMADWIDYLHIAKVDGRWMIVNVLWELKRGGKG